MRGRIIFLLEERSTEELLNTWLPRLFQGWEPKQHFLCIPHEGNRDLDLSIPRTLGSWNAPEDRFIIVRDNDSKNCSELKKNLQKLCRRGHKPNTLVRLICQELESWYLGDLAALSKALGSSKIDTERNRKRYTDPDLFEKPSKEVEKLLKKKLIKRQVARLMGQHLTPETNRSHSLKVFVEGVRQIARSMGYSEGGA